MVNIRVVINFNADRDIVLPVNYNHILQGFIYRNITDKAYASFLHDRGYQVDSKCFKLFTFGRLEGRFKIFPGKILMAPPLRLVVSSALEDFINDFCETLLKRDDQRLLDQRGNIESINVLNKRITEDKLKIKMMSPLVMYSTVDVNSKKLTYYYTPWDEEMPGLLRGNLLNKYKAITGRRAEEKDFSIKTIGPRNMKYRKTLDYEGTIIKGCMGIYKISGDPELLQVAYDCGLGSKSSMGFGCFDILEGGDKSA